MLIHFTPDINAGSWISIRCNRESCSLKLIGPT
jgi:hypothetical protein